MQKFTGKQYLMIDIANSFGLDKLNWDTRLQWFTENEHKLHNLVQEAKDPAMFYAGLQAWEKVRCGEAIGYPISLDATSSGLQILAVLTGDRNAASICNVVDTGDREDAYTVVYDVMAHRLGSSIGQISRDDTKEAVMTSLYGSQAVPKEVFGEGTQLRVFYDVMTDVAPAAWELNEAFLALWNPDAYSHDWVLPDNFHVHIKVMRQEKEIVHFMNDAYTTYYKVNAPTEEGRSLGANCIHSIDGMIVRELARRCNYDPDDLLRVIAALNQDTHGMGMDRQCDKMVEVLWDHYKKTGYLSARILEHLNGGNTGMVDRDVIWELIDSLPEKPFKIIAVHDCFRVLPSYGNDLRTQYNLQLSLIARSNLLQSLLSQITRRPIQIEKLDPNLWRDILDTNYALS